MKHLLLSCLASLAALATLGTAHASNITIPNFNLQVDPAYAGNTVQGFGNNNVITDFVATISSNGDGLYGANGQGAPDGTTAAFINTNNNATVTLTNDLTANNTLTAPTFVAGNIYTLTFAVGIDPTNADQNYDQIGNISFGLTSGGTAVGTQATVARGSITPNVVNDAPQTTFIDVTYTYTASLADNGKAIGIQINDSNDGPSQTEFSDLRLSEVPEPTIWAMMLGSLGVLAFGLRLRGLARR